MQDLVLLIIARQKDHDLRLQAILQLQIAMQAILELQIGNAETISLFQPFP